MFSSELFSFQGRASRSKFWLVFLLSIFVSLVVTLFTLLATPALMIMGYFSPTVASVVSILLYVLMIPMWWISIATSVRRFHDRNKSGWWYLIVLIPLLGALWLIIENGFLKGTVGANTFGNDPLLPNAPSTPPASIPSFTTMASSAPLTPSGISTGTSAGMLIVYIVGGIIIIALLGRLGWAFWQVQQDEAKVETLATATTNSEVKSDTFTASQLANLKADMTEFYLKYQDRDETEKNTEPLQSQIFKEMDAIFLKDLGVVTKITANDFGSAAIFLQPEVSDIISDIETQYGKLKSEPIVMVPTSKIVISDLNYSSVPLSDLSKYATKALTFSVTNVALAKELCIITYRTYDDPKKHPLNSPDTLCNPYYSKVKGVYSDSVYFSNLASSYSGGYDGTSRNYFEIEGIDHVTIEFYLKDTDGKESNRLKLTITSATKNVSTQGTTQSPVVIPTVSTSAPTATITANGVKDLIVSAGTRVTYTWSSTNADSFSGTNSISGCEEAAKEETKTGPSTASGSGSDTMPARFIGCVVTITHTAKNTKNGQQATATATVTVK